eukprot:12231260-Alexandrium_andersonii.AAC.1
MSSPGRIPAAAPASAAPASTSGYPAAPRAALSAGRSWRSAARPSGIGSPSPLGTWNRMCSSM